MTQFVIKTHSERTLTIEADKYNYNATEESYGFFKTGGNKVATLPRHADIQLIVESESLIEDTHAPKPHNNLARSSAQ